MITRSEVAIVCRRLESELQKAGLVVSDLQFKEFETLCIVIDDGPKRRHFSSPRTDSGDGATINALVLWDLLRDLIKLGMNPAIRIRRKRDDQGQTPMSFGAPATRGFLEAFRANGRIAGRRGESRHMIVEDCALSYRAAMPSSRVAKSPKTFQRNTQQRREIREVFERNDRPLAADEVLDLAQQKVTGLGMATVYRTIKALTDEGWLVPVEVPGAPPRYEVRGKAHHHHFHCLKCGKLFELEGCLERLGKLIPPSFRVVDHVVLLYGYCATCARTRKSSFVATRRNRPSKG